MPDSHPFEPKRFRGHPYKLHFVTPRPAVSDGALLIGDAAGLSYNYSGEGIRPALRSALFARETIREAGSDFFSAGLQRYRDRLYAHLGRPVTGRRFELMESLPPVLFQTVGKAIFSSHALKRRFLEHWFLRPGC